MSKTKFRGTKFGQNPLKDVDSRMFTRMLRKDGSITIFFRNFVGEGIISITFSYIMTRLRVSAFGGEDKNMNSLQTTKDTVMTTAHVNLRVRLAKNWTVALLYSFATSLARG
jgi:hypothetical protein